MRRLPVMLFALLAAVLAAALIARAGAASPAQTAFRTPDAGAACKVSGGTLVCSTIASPVSVALGAAGPARPVDRLPWWSAATPVLTTFDHGPLTCHLASGAILCRNHGTAIRVAASGFAVAS